MKELLYSKIELVMEKLLVVYQAINKLRNQEVASKNSSLNKMNNKTQELQIKELHN